MDDAAGVMRCHRGCVITPEVLQTVTSRIVAGSSSSSFTKAGTGGYLVKFSTLARYRRENPAFHRLVIESRQNRLYYSRPPAAQDPRVFLMARRRLAEIQARDPYPAAKPSASNTATSVNIATLCQQAFAQTLEGAAGLLTPCESTGSYPHLACPRERFRGNQVLN